MVAGLYRCMIADPTKINSFAGLGEPVSAVTHLAAAGVFAWLSFGMLRRAGQHTLRRLCISIYVFAVIFQLVISGVYHWLPPGSVANKVLLRIDHAAIFFLIAASFTPIHVILFKGFARWGVLAFIWPAAITGIVLKSVITMPMALGASLYAGLGWVGLVTGIMTWRRYGPSLIKLMFYGGVAYTIGLLIEWWMADASHSALQIIPGVIGGHELFHIAVISGIAIHWALIYRIADGTYANESRLLAADATS